jgi:trehalose 6-phosphate phosphatase
MKGLDVLRAHPEATGVFLDFDGTLSPIVPEPSAATIVPGAKEVLEEIARRYKLVAFISGRRAEDLRRRVGARGPRYFGLYGAEEMTDSGLRQSALASRWRQSAAELAEEAFQLIENQQLAGCEVELKDLAVSLHYRRTGRDDPPDSLMAWARKAAAAAGFGAGIGRKVIELRPKLVSKAETFQELVLETEVANAFVAGDDSADVQMMRAAERVIPGVVVRAGIRSPEEPEGMAEQADLDVRSPVDLVATLRMLI